MRPPTTSTESTSQISPPEPRSALGEQPLEAFEVAVLRGLQEALEQRLPLRRVGVEARAAGPHVPARPCDELAAVRLLAADDPGDRRVVVVEHVAEHERGALDRRELLEHDEERLRQRVGQLGPRARPRRRVLHQRLGQPRSDVRLAPDPRQPQVIDREAGRHGRDPCGRLVEGLPGARQPQQRLLHDVLGVGDAAEHPVGDAEPVAPEGLELLVGHHLV
jgi:hypothetical protein